jgi:hypothetical protein
MRRGRYKSLFSHRKRPGADFPARSNSPRKRKDRDVIIAKRGGTGPAAKQTPDPRTTHSPKAIVQVVCKW